MDMRETEKTLGDQGKDVGIRKRGKGYRELKRQRQMSRQGERGSKIEEAKGDREAAGSKVGRRVQAYMRWVLSGVQSGRYLAPSSRALSRSSERKGFWKPLSTTTTP